MYLSNNCWASTTLALRPFLASSWIHAIHEAWVEMSPSIWGKIVPALPFSPLSQYAAPSQALSDVDTKVLGAVHPLPLDIRGHTSLPASSLHYQLLSLADVQQIDALTTVSQVLCFLQVGFFIVIWATTAVSSANLMIVLELRWL